MKKPEEPSSPQKKHVGRRELLMAGGIGVAAFSACALSETFLNLPIPILRTTPQPTRSLHPTSTPAVVLPELQDYLLQRNFHTLQTKTGTCIIPPMVQIPNASKFLMGSDIQMDPLANNNQNDIEHETPPFPVTVNPFSISLYEVTVIEYQYAVLLSNGLVSPPQTHGDPHLTWENQLAYPNRPVVDVSWNDARNYVIWLARITWQNWRLPTEAEWEKAARWDENSQHSRIYPWGDTWDETLANTLEAGPGNLTDVGSYPNGRSPYGLYDMAGNAVEWTHSGLEKYPYASGDGREEEGRSPNVVNRGGNYLQTKVEARCAWRGGNGPDSFGIVTGFRVALG